MSPEGKRSARGPSDTLTHDALSRVSWHSLEVDEALRRLGSTREGLDAAEAARRLASFGPNRLHPPTPVSALRILANQFASLVVLLLLAAAVVSALLGDVVEAAAIAAVLAINTLMGFVPTRACSGQRSCGRTRLRSPENRFPSTRPGTRREETSVSGPWSRKKAVTVWSIGTARSI